jgi:tetratricopeptide (TPR) repeat protein
MIATVAIVCAIFLTSNAVLSQTCDKTDYDCQIKKYRSAIGANPKDAESYYNLAYALQGKEQYADSIPLLTTYLASGVTNTTYLADAYSLRGYANRILDHFDLAVSDYTKAIGYVSNKSSYYLNRGTSYSRLKKYDLALVDFTKTIELDSGNASAVFRRGVVYMDLKNNPPAIADFTRVIALDPNESEAYYNRGTIYYRQSKFALAAADLTKYIEMNAANERNMADGYLNRGLANFYLGDSNSAISDYTKAIELNPNMKKAYVYRAEAYRKVGKIALAEVDEKRAATINQ